jgi:hypothetical protein
MTAQIWHLAANVVPTGAVSGLLSNRGDRSPFQGTSSEGFFEARWRSVQRDLLGDGRRNNIRNLSRRYVIHIAFAVGTTVWGWLLWRQCRRRRQPRWVAAWSSLAFVIGGFLMIVTPLYYGALLKSYQYPLVTIIPKLPYADHEDLKAEFDRALGHSQFLLESTSGELYLFDSKAGVRVLARDTVAMVKVITEDFVFRNPQ